MTKAFSHIAIVVMGFLARTSVAMSVDLLPPDLNSTTIPEPSDDDFPTTTTPNCTFQQLQPDDVIQLKGKLLIKSNNIAFPNSEPFVFEPASNLCFTRSESLNREIFAICEKWAYDEDEYSVLPDGTVKFFDEVLEPGSFAIKNGKLETCADDDEDIGGDGNSTGKVPSLLSEKDTWSIYIGQIGSAISIVALTAHLVSFCCVPTMRNLPGYNLASLSGAFLLAYLFSLIGQIPEVLGFFCVLCGILVQLFFLAAFFCMNTLAFDVWRTLKMATTKLCMSSQNAKRRQFIYYSIYSWGTPLLITITCVIIDNTPTTLDWIKPDFGKNDICWMTKQKAKIAFFMTPAFALFVANVIFFVLSAFIIRTHSMKCGSEDQRQSARNNFVLYVRLATMMGVTWLFGVVATIVDDFVVWLIFDIMNSLQGLFVFVLFTCSRKVFDHVREKFHLEIAMRTPKTSTSDLTGKTIVSNHKS